MYGLGLGISAARANELRPLASPIVAWGDSLTAAGYPAIAGGLFSPARSPVNKGLGGQGSYSISAPRHLERQHDPCPRRHSLVMEL